MSPSATYRLLRAELLRAEHGGIARQVVIAPGVVLDVDADGQAIGIEVIGDISPDYALLLAVLHARY